MKNFNTLLFVGLSILLVAVHAHGGHECVHDSLKIDSEVGMHHEDPTGRGRILADWAPFRIATDFANLDTLNSTLKAQYPTFVDYVKNTLVPAAVRWVSATYQVKQYTSPLQAPNNKVSCGYNDSLIQYPSSIINGSSLPDTDLMVVVGWANDVNASWIARAYTCASDAATNRTYIGGIQFNLKYANSNESQWQSNLAVTLHEMTHLLFMSGDLFPKYIDPDTNAVLTNVVGYRNVSGVNSSVLVHPKIVAEAKSYFGCPDLDHVQIENQGGSGSLGSHWERKWFGNEFITATSGDRMPVSRMTLVLAEISGWYKSNFSMAEPLVWGKNQGCDFLLKPCLSGRNDTNKNATLVASSPMFCSDPNIKGCDYEFTAGAGCSLASYTNGVPGAWDYFRDNRTGGFDNYRDYCPIVSSYGNRYCSGNGPSPTKQYEYYPESFGPRSACFVSSFINGSYYPTSIGGQCYQYNCNLQTNGSYTLDVLLADPKIKDPVKVTCTTEKQQITYPSVPNSSDYSGSMTCPDPTTFCQLKAGYCLRGCGGADGGVCNNGVCTCKAGRTGADCLRTAPTTATA